MSKQSLKQFIEIESLKPFNQEKLKAVTDRESFVKLTVQLGEESGYSFTTEELEAAITPSDEGQEGELSEEELEQVAGGGLTSKCWGETNACWSVKTIVFAPQQE